MWRADEIRAWIAAGLPRDDDDAPQSGDIVAPIEVLVASLVEGLEAAENHLRGLGFDPVRLQGAQGFDRIAALRDAVNTLYTTDEVKRRFEIMAHPTNAYLVS